MANQVYRDAIAAIESAGSGGYSAVGPSTNGSRPYGRYQVMDFNIGPWTEAALGRRLTPQEFLNDQAAQDAVFDHVFGGYVERYGPEGAAQAWFGGPGSVGQTGRTDILGTDVGSYGQRFMSYVNQNGGPGLMTTAGERIANRPAGEVGPVQQRLQGGSPILERIRDRLRAQGREATPILDAMIENRKRRAQTDRPLLNWMREQRQSAGYNTPILDRILGNNTPAAPVNKSATPLGDTGSKNRNKYTVRNGDTLSAIASRNGVPLDQLIAANPQIANPGRISPGQQVNIPGQQQDPNLWAQNNPTTLSAPPRGRPVAPSPTPQGTMGGWPVTTSPGFAPTPLAFHAPPASASQPTPYDATRNASPLRNDPGATVTKAPKQFSLSPQQGDPLMTAGMDLGTYKDLKTRQAALMNPNPTPKFPPPLGAEGIYAVTGQSTSPAAPRTTLPAGMPVATKPPVLSPVKMPAPALVAQKAAAQKLPYVPGK